MGISPAIGLMLLNIGLGSNAGVYNSKGEGAFYVMRDFFGALTPSLATKNMGDGYPTMVLTVVTMFVGLFVIIILAHKGINGAVLFGMLSACVIYWAGEALFFHTNPFAALATASFVPPVKDMVDTTLFKLDFKDFISIGWFTAVSLIITFCIIDMFDTIGTLIGVSDKAGMLDKEGKLPRVKNALLADAIATSAGAVLGTSTTTTFVESSAGVGAGARTGFASVVTGFMFLIAILFAPIFTAIPGFATAPALIFVGFLMVSAIVKIDFNDVTEAAPAYLCLIAMPLMYSIAEGIAIGVISYVIINLICGKAKKLSLIHI